MHSTRARVRGLPAKAVRAGNDFDFFGGFRDRSGGRAAAAKPAASIAAYVREQGGDLAKDAVLGWLILQGADCGSLARGLRLTFCGTVPIDSICRE